MIRERWGRKKKRKMERIDRGGGEMGGRDE
jgi:hypothetical protein